MRICVCLSVGRHPVSGRERMAARDRVALELALASGADVVGLHAGDGSENILRDYLGMGFDHLEVFRAGGWDAADVAARGVLAERPDLVMCGERAETGEGTGLFPYLLAERLGWPLLSGIGGFSFEGDRLELLQVERGGRRRIRTGAGPAVLVAAPGAAHPRFSSLAAARAGTVRRHASAVPPLPEQVSDLRPARIRGARLRPGRAGAAPTGQVRTDLTPTEAASAIIEFLRGEGYLAPAPSPSNETTRNA